MGLRILDIQNSIETFKLKQDMQNERVGGFTDFINEVQKENFLKKTYN